jgi:hypothetical protein
MRNSSQSWAERISPSGKQEISCHQSSTLVLACARTVLAGGMRCYFTDGFLDITSHHLDRFRSDTQILLHILFVTHRSVRIALPWEKGFGARPFL